METSRVRMTENRWGDASKRQPHMISRREDSMDVQRPYDRSCSGTVASPLGYSGGNHELFPPRNKAVPFKKRKRFQPGDRSSRGRQRQKFSNGHHLTEARKREFSAAPQSPMELMEDKKAAQGKSSDKFNSYQSKNTSKDRVATEGIFDSRGKNTAAVKKSSLRVRAAALAPNGPTDAPTRPFASQLFEEDSKAAVVSDGQSPDIYDTSTASSSSLSLDNASVLRSGVNPMGAEKLADIPRQIETPTKSLLEKELEEKIPKKKSKLPVSSVRLNVKQPSRQVYSSLERTQNQAADDAAPEVSKISSQKLKIHISCKSPSKAEEESRSPSSVDYQKMPPIPELMAPTSSVATPGPAAVKDASEEPHLTPLLKIDPDPPARVPERTQETENSFASQAATESSQSTLPSASIKSPAKTAGAASASIENHSSTILAYNSDYHRVQIGARVSVYWDGEDAYFDATVTKERPHKKKRFYLEYDDGDREWINLRKQEWRLLGGGKAIAPTPHDAVAKGGKDKLGKEDNTQVQNTNQDVDQTVVGEGSRGKMTPVPKKKPKKPRQVISPPAWIHDDEWVVKAAKKSESDSETDDDEVMQFARQMLGVEKPPVTRPKKKLSIPEPLTEPDFKWEDLESSGIQIPISEKVKMGRRRSRIESAEEQTEAEIRRLKKKKKRRKLLLQSRAAKQFESDGVVSQRVKSDPLLRPPTVLPDSAAAARKKRGERRSTEPDCSQPPFQDENEEELNRRKKEEARTLTTEEIRAILGEDDDPCGTSSHWVRRSARMPSRSVLNTPKFKLLIEKLKSNDPDMVVLKMKKYLSDPDCPQVCIDTVLDALEENTNCQSLYIQNFNEGMRDKQVLRLLEILKKPSCNIWCLNIGETYKVKTRTWKALTRGLKDTKITHMYASEHTISSELKERIRTTIRENRKKHTMHIDPDNLDVIVRCTHCWWNPINAKVLRPHLHRKGYSHILNDKEAQGLRGTDSGASLL